MSNRPEDEILKAYDAVLVQHGDTAQGAHWPNEADRITRFNVMLELLAGTGRTPAVVCDLACGTGGLLGHIRSLGLDHVSYIGADRSAAALAYARAKYPDERFVEIDVTDRAADVQEIACDYLVCNGLFTVKWGLSQAEMWRFMEETIVKVWPVVRKGLAFNVMSKAVDWERDDLFHVPMDDVAMLLHKLAGRNVVLRADYGLYEYTAYARRPG